VTSFLSHSFPGENKSPLFHEESKQKKRLNLCEFSTEIKELSKEKDILNGSIHKNNKEENEHSSFHNKVTNIFR